MEYDGILKWDEDGKGCSTCFLQEPEACTNEIKCGYPYGHKAYMNIVQLACLIKEAEAGAHSWVRDNTPFICSIRATCNNGNGEDGEICNPHHFMESSDFPCSGRERKSVPFRGKKGELQKFGGIDKRIIESLIEECDAEAGPTAEDCSEVTVGFICSSRWPNGNCAHKECNLSKTHSKLDGGVPHCYSESALAKEDRQDIKSKWDDDGEGCNSCKFVSEYAPCDRYTSELCSPEAGKSMYQRKEDRSDLEYNKKSEFLRDEAGEVINSGGIEIVINDDLTPLSDIKVKAEVQEEYVEYVVAEHLSLRTLAFSNMSAGIFREFFKVYNEIKWSKGEAFAVNDTSAPFATELIRCGFIERKVVDPVVKQGDTFAKGADRFIVAQVAKCKYQLISLIDGNRYADLIVDFPNREMRLSDFLIVKSRLSEFKPCKVSIEVKE